MLNEESQAGLTADFQTFLKLLTTQLESQDPLQPLESTEFVAQLASFSAVEQQVKSNETLESILSALSEANTGALADWLGREVRAAAPKLYDDRPITAYPPDPPAGAASATLLVRSGEGGIVAEVPFEPGSKEVVWDGKRNDGVDPKAGDAYSFDVRYALSDSTSETVDAEVFARVTEARREDGGIVLSLEGGGEADAETVSAVREPVA